MSIKLDAFTGGELSRRTLYVAQQPDLLPADFNEVCTRE
jgi:hypothetical protein